MKTGLVGFVLGFVWILVMPLSVVAAPIKTYQDASGHEVWQMTNRPEFEGPDYYTSPLFSPNGKYFVFHDSSAYPSYLSIMNSDGTNRRVFGTRQDQSGGGSSFGWWSNDSKYYYVTSGLYRNNAETAASEDFVTNVSSYLPFNYPMISPDGRILSGISNLGDSSTQGTLKFINADGTNYYEYKAPGWTPAAGGGSASFDVTHGWVGNNHIWYLNDSVGSLYRDIMRVVDVGTRQYVGSLDAVQPDGSSDWTGIFDHPCVSSEGYMVGGVNGMVAGYGSPATILGGFGRANSLLVNTQADVVAKKFTGVASNSYPAFTSPNGVQCVFSPDGKWIMTYNVSGNCGSLVSYPIDKTKSPIWLAAYGPTSMCGEWENGLGPYATYSPDSTKVIFGSRYEIQSDRNIKKTGSTYDTDVYIVVAKKPETPQNLKAILSGGNVLLTWQSATSHKEIKQYEVEKSNTIGGPWVAAGVVPEVYTYLDAPSKISMAETVITVDSTVNFPSSGVLEISGLSNERSSELVAYTGKTTNQFTGCTRGYGGSVAAEHYNDAFVWLSPTFKGFSESVNTAYPYYRIRSVEWSGLKSDYSQIVSVNTSTIPTSVPTMAPKPGDANGDGLVNLADYAIWLVYYGRSLIGPAYGDFDKNGVVDGRDYVIWVNNFGI